MGLLKKLGSYLREVTFVGSRDRARDARESGGSRGGVWEDPAIYDDGREQPSLTHCCSYASGHLPESTTRRPRRPEAAREL
ncbi:MAG: hypothetical protein HYW25_03520 [Candidatus Aenigmarchaeota archaeon]|nr:hypothetical protein [Candidatus Aenigmarchaeota archaeon]